MSPGTYAARIALRDWKLEQIQNAIMRLRYNELESTKLTEDAEWLLDRIEELAKPQ